jgi:septal ring-binding cell division protein DamX
VTAGIYFLLVGSDQQEPDVSTISIALPINQADPVVVEKPKQRFTLEPVEQPSMVKTEQRKPLEQVLTTSEAEQPVIEQLSIEQTTRPVIDLPIEAEVVSRVEVKNAAVEVKPLPTVSSTPVTIQLMVVSEVSTLQDMLRQYPTLPLEIIKTKRDGKDSFVLICGAYRDKNTARDAIETLPAQLKKASPWVRFRADI